VIRVEVFVSSDCQRCDCTVQIVQRIAADLDDEIFKWRKVDVIEELDYAVELGVLATPSVAIDGNLIFTAAPSIKALRLAVEQHMKGNGCI